MSKIILVTGASSGFGKAIAEKFAAGGWNLILTARRKEKLEAVASNIEKQYGVKTHSLVFDIQNKEDVFEKLSNLPSEWQAVRTKLDTDLHDTVLRGRKLMKNLFRLALFAGSAWVVVESAKALAVF